MHSSVQCMMCQINKAVDQIPATASSERQRDYLQAVLALFTDGQVESAPVYSTLISQLHTKWWGAPEDIYTTAKAEHNRLVGQLVDGLQAKLKDAEDPLELAIKIARAGNYLDMGVLRDIKISDLQTLLEDTLDEALNPKVYALLRDDLEKASRLVYVVDNCGEVVLDSILLHKIKVLYPELDITVVVRGQAALNDVTLADAEAIGLTHDFAVVGNGAGVPGTPLDRISEEAKTILNEADVIIAKGQGNFETMYGCGLNVYYLLLCKCDYFMEKFKMPRFGSIFLRDDMPWSDARF